jgi:hypothetical protein
MKTVVISECKSGGRVWKHTARTDSDQVAINRAILKHFGRKAGFHRDQGLSNIGMYGQITKPAPGQGNAWDCVTGRVSIRVEN